MAWNQYAALGYGQYRQIVGNGPLNTPNAFVALLQAAAKYNVDPRALLTQLQFENQFGRDISSTQLANNNYAGIKYANQPGASPGGASPEGDQYAKFDSVGSFMNALGQSLSWYVKTFPDRNSYYNDLVSTYPAGADTSAPSASDLVNQGGAFNLTGGLQSAAQGAQSTASDLLNATPFGAALQWITNPDNALRLIIGFAGIVLIVGGLLEAAGSNQSIREAATTAAVAAA